MLVSGRQGDTQLDLVFLLPGKSKMVTVQIPELERLQAVFAGETINSMDNNSAVMESVFSITEFFTLPLGALVCPVSGLDRGLPLLI